MQNCGKSNVLNNSLEVVKSFCAKDEQHFRLVLTIQLLFSNKQKIVLLIETFLPFELLKMSQI